MKGFAADSTSELPETPAVRPRAARIAAVVAELNDVAATLLEDDTCGDLDPVALLERLYSLQADIERAADLSRPFVRTERIYSEDTDSASDDDFFLSSSSHASSFDVFVSLDRRPPSVSSTPLSSEKTKKKKKQHKAKKRAQQKQEEHDRQKSPSTTPKPRKLSAPVHAAAGPREATD